MRKIIVIERDENGNELNRVEMPYTPDWLERFKEEGVVE